MNLLSWVIFGLVVGTITNIISPSPSRSGLLGTIILGITGALLGGFLANLIFNINILRFDAQLNIQSLIIATIGAIIILFIQRLTIKKDKHIKTTIKEID